MLRLLYQLYCRLDHNSDTIPTAILINCRDLVANGLSTARMSREADVLSLNSGNDGIQLSLPELIEAPMMA
jgi:hypothetical protein